MDAIAFKCMIQHFLADVFVDFLLGCEIGVGRLKYSSKKKQKKNKKKKKQDLFINWFIQLKWWGTYVMWPVGMIEIETLVRFLRSGRHFWVRYN